MLGIRPGPVTAVINRADRTNDAKLVMSEIRQGYLEFGGNVRVAKTVIPSAVVYKEAATHRTPAHRMRSALAFDTMHELVWELVPNLDGVYDVGTILEGDGTDVTNREGGNHEQAPARRRPRRRPRSREVHEGSAQQGYCRTLHPDAQP